MSLINELPAIFDSFSDARRQGFLTVLELKEQNIPLVGTYCTFMPQEIALAAGAVVVSLCSTSDETIEEAEKDLPRNLCPLIKSSYGFGKTDKCPYFYFSDLVVGETTCDGKKKCMSTWPSSNQSMSCSYQTAPAMTLHVRYGELRFCGCRPRSNSSLAVKLASTICVRPLR